MAGLLVSVNNNAPGGRTLPSLALRVLGGGSSTAPVDLSTVRDGDALLAGQTIHFRIYPAHDGALASDFW